MSFPVITIDGPSGAGKGTVCFMLAQALGYRLLDSGALYRIVGLQAVNAGLLAEASIDTNGENEDTPIDEAKIAKLTESLTIEFFASATGQVDIVVNGEHVADEIRNETVGGYASKVAALPKVRAALLALQKNMANSSGLIADGRDMGTVVFPDADAKIFLTASAEARAQRRLQQLQSDKVTDTVGNADNMNNVASSAVDYDTILTHINQRDARDENRAVAPSKPAADALIIDSSNLPAAAVYEQIKDFCQKKGICFSSKLG